LRVIRCGMYSRNSLRDCWSTPKKIFENSTLINCIKSFLKLFMLMVDGKKGPTKWDKFKVISDNYTRYFLSLIDSPISSSFHQPEYNLLQKYTLENDYWQMIWRANVLILILFFRYIQFFYFIFLLAAVAGSFFYFWDSP
jgi:hypothetical protein